MASEPVPLPSSWFEVDPLTGDDRDIRSMLRGPSHRLVEIIRRTPPAEGAVLTAGMRSMLGGHALFAYPRECGALHATAMLAGWIGLDPASVHEDLGGTVTIVQSGLGHRDDQKWHTDSTPWRQPNRLTLLGQMHLAKGFDPPATELLPFASVDAALSSHPEALQLLRSSPVPWRRNFPQRSQFDAPILAIDAPRWVGSVLDRSSTELPAKLRSAIEIFRSVIEVLPYEHAVVAPGRLLIFDNHANLHRGPNIEQELERRLVRIKIGGTTE